MNENLDARLFTAFVVFLLVVVWVAIAFEIAS